MTEAEKWFNEGVNLFEAHKFFDAIEAFTKAEINSPDGKYPLASFNKGNSYYQLGHHEEAIISYIKAENDSPEGKYPDASINKGNSYAQLGQYQEEIISYIKAENDSPDGKYPVASFNKGVFYDDFGRYEEAIISFTRAENDSPGGKYPLASYNKGVSYGKLGRHEEAIISYTKAEIDSPDGKYPDASNNKGIIYAQLGQYGEAIISYTKAENDSPDGKYYLASHNKGNSYVQLGRPKEAIISYTKAENDSPDGKYPFASFNKGVFFRDFGSYEEAIISYTKAENDSPDGKYPLASHNKGYSYAQLGQYEEAIISYTKAENDSPDGKYPDASHNKGNAYVKLGQYEEAIISYTMAENDSPDGKYPDASANKAVIKTKKLQYYDALSSAKKSIEDSENNFFPIGFFVLGQVYEALQDFDAAADSFLTAFIQDNKNLEYLEKLTDYSDNQEYINRREYLEHILIGEYYKNNKSNEKIFALIREMNEESIDIYCHILLWNEDILCTGLSPFDRYRLVYLIYASQKKWSRVFYIIDNILDNGTFELEPVDHYYYIISASAIAEPAKVVNSLIGYSRFDGVKVSELIDDYMIRIIWLPFDINMYTPRNDLEKSVLSSILQGKPFDCPVPMSRMKTILLGEISIEVNTEDDHLQGSPEYNNFRNSIYNDNPDFNTIAFNIDSCLGKSKEFLKLIMSDLNSRIATATQNEFQDLTYLRAYLLLKYANIRTRERNRFFNISGRILKAELITLAFESVAGYFVTLALLPTLGFTAVIAIVLHLFEESFEKEVFDWEEFTKMLEANGDKLLTYLKSIENAI